MKYRLVLVKEIPIEKTGESYREIIDTLYMCNLEDCQNNDCHYDHWHPKEGGDDMREILGIVRGWVENIVCNEPDEHDQDPPDPPQTLEDA